MFEYSRFYPGLEWYHSRMNEPLVTLANIAVRLGQRSVLQDVSLTINEDEIVTLIGPNGAGKTTLVRVVLGLQNIHKGQIKRRAKLRIGYMPQRFQINEHMPMRVVDFLRLDGSSRDEATNALEESGIRTLENAQVSRVSGGELQRVLFARALLRDPELLVLDEPVQGVDLAGQAGLYQLIDQARKRHQCGVLMVSHDLNIVMANTDNVVCLNHHICCHGHPDHVSTDPAFLELFGHRFADTLAVYHHQHDHEHDLHGDIIEKSHE